MNNKENKKRSPVYYSIIAVVCIVIVLGISSQLVRSNMSWRIYHFYSMHFTEKNDNTVYDTYDPESDSIKLAISQQNDEPRGCSCANCCSVF